MLLVFVPLLEEASKRDVLKCVRAIIDFITLAIYRSYDDDIL